jgi:hypothetical protein
MRKYRAIILPLLMPMMLVACDGGASSSVGGLPPGEAQALNDAAEMLDESNQPKAGEPQKEPAKAE